jgi:hypothetical protein
VRGPAAEFHQEFADGFAWAFDEGLDATVAPVADPAFEVEPIGHVLDEGATADALHEAGDREAHDAVHRHRM